MGNQKSEIPMTKEVYEELKARWGRIGHVYSDFGARKLKPILANRSLFKRRTVVDLGSNNGRNAYEISGEAKGIIGVEMSTVYVAQSLITAKYMACPFVSFPRGVGEFFKTSTWIKYDSLLAVDILFYLSVSDISAIKNFLKATCQTAMLISNEKRKPDRLLNPDFRKASRLKKFLRSAGFHVTVDDQIKNYICVMGRRK